MGQDIRNVPRLLSGQANHVWLSIPEKCIQSPILASNYYPVAVGPCNRIKNAFFWCAQYSFSTIQIYIINGIVWRVGRTN